MVRAAFVSALLWAAGLVAASPSPAPLVAVRTRNFPGTSDEFTLHAVWRRLAALAHHRRDNVFKNSTSIDKSWSDATLFSYTFAPNTSSVDNLEAELSIEVTCVTCYFKAGATAELTVDGELDLGGRLRNLTDQLGDELHNMTKTAVDSLAGVAKNFWEEVKDLFTDDDFELDDLINFDHFHVDTDIDIDLPPLPAVQLLFQIDYLDLYMEMDTTIAASTTLSIPLYKSQTAVGISAGEGLEIGLFVTMDLILSAEGEITLRSGFHLLLDDPVGFKLAMFSSDVSDIIFNGGKFEFLPVTIISGSIALKAVLRVGMHAGFSISSEGLIPGEGITSVGKKLREAATFHAGVEVGVFANVAEFLTNITGGATQAAEDGCALKIVEEYTLAIGAAAGATVGIGSHTWGPQPDTTVPIFYTTLADVCAVSASATPSPTGVQLPARQAVDPNLETQTISTQIRYTGVACASPDLPLCPQSLLTTTILTTTKTLVTAVPPGVQATFPPSTTLAVASTIPFGDKANQLAATSGAPVSFVPPPPPSPSTSSTAEAGGDKGDGEGGVLDDIGEVWNGSTGGVENRLVIGLSVGLGVPVLVGVVWGLVAWRKRRRYEPVPKTDTTVVEYTGAYQSPMSAERDSMIKKGPEVVVGEVRE